ncbi:MAG: hypothetical protein ACP5HQ_03465 [Thermoprotei archaeon]
MVTEILKLTGGSTKKEFTKTELATFLGMSKSSAKKLDPILDELVKEGFIRITRTRRNAKYYALSESKAAQAQPQAVQPQTDLSSLKGVVKEAVKEALMEYFGTKEVTVSDLERVYDFVKNDLGMASIKDIREQLGLTLEQFMAKFRDYILQNFELISGGKEGFVKGGILYGIIRKKR